MRGNEGRRESEGRRVRGGSRRERVDTERTKRMTSPHEFKSYAQMVPKVEIVDHVYDVVLVLPILWGGRGGEVRGGVCTSVRPPL